MDVFPFPDSSYRGPDPRFTRLRMEQPVARVHTHGGVDAWLVTRYEDVFALSADTRLSRAAACGPGAPKVGGAMTSTPEMIISMDTHEHSRVRRLLAKAFAPRRIEQMRPRVQRVVDELLDSARTHGSPIDLVEYFTVPMPLAVIGGLLGVPARDLREFEKWAREFATVNDRAGGEQSTQGLAKLNEYIVGLIADKRVNPGDDMLSWLISTRDNEDRLSERELVTYGFTLLGAGFDTVACQLANSILALVERHRDQWLWLVEDPGRIPGAVDELLRHVNLFGTDTTGFPRVALAEIAVGDVVIRPGEVVLLSLSSANRDETVFPDPDRLDLSREPKGHLSFGHGIHYCPGEYLARIELELALAGLVRRFPDLRLAVSESELPWHPGEINHTLLAMPVTW